MSTSGKIDKQRLRAFYENSITRAQISTRMDCNSHYLISPTETCADQLGRAHLSNSTELAIDKDSEISLRQTELARMVLASVLGLDNLNVSGKQVRPRDDEDFYILGGSSLLVSSPLFVQIASYFLRFTQYETDYLFR